MTEQTRRLNNRDRVGVGEIPSGPYGCENCQWVEPSVDEVCLGLSDEAMAQPDSDEGAE